MFHQAFSSDSLERKLLVFRQSNSKPKIRIEKGRLPQNFFRPFMIATTQEEGYNKEPASTPYFGSYQQASKPLILHTTKQEIPRNKERKQFHSWFRKNNKSLSSRVQTVPAQISQPKPTKRHASERKTRMERIRSVRQEEGTNSSVMRIFKRYEHLIRGDSTQLESESYNKIRIKPSLSEGAQEMYKNSLKTKRGYAETKYKQAKALNSISTDRQTSSLTLPLISNT